MDCSRIEGTLADALRKRCLPTLALLLALAAGRCLGPQAAACASVTIFPAFPHPGTGASTQSNGNGKFNKNVYLIGSIVIDKSVQGIRNGNAGGRIINSQALCNGRSTVN